MVSLQYKMMVNEELKKLGLHYVILDLGVFEILEDIALDQRLQLKKNLMKSGLELLDDAKSILIINVIIEMIHNTDILPPANDSDYICEKVG
ncbi:hypothetical protein N9164_16270 [Draconibacterium sp.]|nr:hypothetical protein [Draconibacterium sp.]